MEKSIKNLTIYPVEVSEHYTIPFVDEGIKAGFPSPAQDYIEQGIDLNRELIKHPSSTFLAKVDGNSMQDTFIHDGDIVIIDKSLEPRDGCKVVAYIEGEFVMKTIQILPDKILLIPENQDYPTITVTSDQQFVIWGVVTYVIHKLY